MTSAKIQSESNFAKHNSPATQIANRRQDISSAGSTCLAAIAASVLIAWSVWNNRPSQPTAPAIQPLEQMGKPSAPALGNLDQGIQSKEHGAFVLPAEASVPQK
jgi:hypothetical protein